MKILHLSDVHANNDDLDEVVRCTQHVLEVARAEGPDLIIDSGDIFDSRHIRADSPAVKHIHRWMKDMADIAPVARVMGTYSHDGRASELLDLIGAKWPIRTAVEGPMQVLLTIGGSLATAEEHQGMSSGLYEPVPVCAVISLVPAPTKEHLVGMVDGDIKETDAIIAQGLAAMFAGLAAQAGEHRGVPHILVGHWNTSGAFISPTQMLTGVDIEVSRDQMMMASPDLVCLGHIHKAQQIGSDPIFYAGSTQINTWGELDAKGVWIHEFEDGEWSHRFLQTPTRRRILIAFDFTRHDADPSAALLRETAKLPVDNPQAILPGSMVQARIKYFQDDEARFDDATLAAVFPGAHSVDIQRTRVPRANVRAASILETERLRDKIVEQAELTGEPIPAGALEAADMLEDLDPETLARTVEALADGEPEPDEIEERRAA